MVNIAFDSITKVTKVYRERMQTNKGDFIIRRTTKAEETWFTFM